MNFENLISALDELEEEKGISKEVVLDALKEALEKAYKKDTDPDVLCRADINAVTGKIEMYELKNVVEEVEDDLFEIELEDAKELKADAKVGDVLEIAIDTETLSRLAVQQAMQVFRQKIREFEKQAIYDQYIDKKDDIMVGTIDRIEPPFIFINMGGNKSEVVMNFNQTIPGESFKPGQTVRAYVVKVDNSSKGHAVEVSRIVPGFLKRLFENEIPEIYDGTVEIKKIAREAGDRAKVAVFSRNKDVDATGACIGQKGLRIQKISNQILGEKIDVINYYEDTVLYIAEALKPAEVIGVALNEEAKSAIAIVKDDSFSLAIGKRGINARLAVSLTGYKIDIKTLTTAVEEGIEYTTVDQARANYEYNQKAPVIEEVVEEKVEEPVKLVEEEPVKVEVKVEEKKEEVKVEAKPKTEKPLKMPKFLKENNEKPSKKDDSKPSGTPKKKKEDDKDSRRTVLSSKELEDIKKKNEEARSYMPVYTDDELEELEDENDDDNYYDDVDYDEYDKYYDED